MDHFYLLANVLRKIPWIQPKSLINRQVIKNALPKSISVFFPQREKKCVRNPIIRSDVNFIRRLYSNDNSPRKLQLMDFDIIIWPSFFKTIKNWIYTGMIMRPHLDPDFGLTNFVDGAKQAAEIVSHHLSEGRLDELENLLTPDCLAEVQKNLSLLNATQRHELAVKKKDIYFSFPYELGIIFDGGRSSSDPQKREVEVTVVHHVLRGHADMIERGEAIPLNIGVLPEFQERIFILNYRFIRNYSKGVTDQWTLNVVNHFKPSQHVN